jgi:iron complex transport system ATP-binding protein
MSSEGRRILELNDVSFSYTAEGFIKGLHMWLGEREFIGLLGANGSGKSTILKLFSGILGPSTGTVNLWGRPMASCRNRDRAKLLSYLPQVLDMSVPFRVGELVGMGRYPYDGEPGMSVEEALVMVGLEGKRDEYLTRLSGGERRRAYIAMTLLQGAGILLLDEPLANLDIRYQVELIRLLEDLNRRPGISILMALHDINLALRFPKLVLVKDGMILAAGTPEDVLTEDLLRHAFGTDVRVRKNGEESYISYGGARANG